LKITVPLKELNKKMTSISTIVPSKTTMPVLGTVLIGAAKDGISLSATDLDVSVTSRIEGEVGEEGTIAAPARKLAEISKSLSGDKVDIETDGEKVKVQCGKARFVINGRYSADFPQLPKQESKAVFNVSKELLSTMISKTSYAVSTDISRPALCGVLWEVDRQGLSMVATDGHRLAKVESNVSIEGVNKTEVIVPIKALSALKTFSEDSKEIEIGLGENSIRFNLYGNLVYSRLLEGPFPNYKKVIPTSNEKELVVSKSLLSEATKRVSILSDALTHQVIFSLAKDKLTLNVVTQELGEATEEIEASYNDDPMDIGYNANYIMDVLKTIDTDDIVFMLDRPDNAGLIRPSSESGDMKHICIIMPLRLS